MITIESLFEAGAHFGHRTYQWSPTMAPYIYGERAGVHIIDLDKTLAAIAEVFPKLAEIYANGNKILFVGTKRAARPHIIKIAEALGMPYVSKRWLGGTLTNYKTIRRSIRHLVELEGERDDGFFERITKKEALEKTREILRLKESIGGIRDMSGLPDMLFIVDIDFEKIAVMEAKRLGIPIVALVDTNSRPELVDQVIPMNDDSSKAVALILGELEEACKLAKASALSMASEQVNKEHHRAGSNESLATAENENKENA